MSKWGNWRAIGMRKNAGERMPENPQKMMVKKTKIKISSSYPEFLWNLHPCRFSLHQRHFLRNPVYKNLRYHVFLYRCDFRSHFLSLAVNPWDACRDKKNTSYMFTSGYTRKEHKERCRFLMRFFQGFSFFLLTKIKFLNFSLCTSPLKKVTVLLTVLPGILPGWASVPHDLPSIFHPK